MATGPSAYLVIRRDDGFGDVYPAHRRAALQPRAGQHEPHRRQGRAVSREHAEVTYADGRWRLRDLGSLNGTRLNDTAVDSEWELSPGDEISIGRARLVFVEDMSQLPDVPLGPRTDQEDGAVHQETTGADPVPDAAAGYPPVADDADATAIVSGGRHSLSRDLALLYRLALDMGSCTTYEDLARTVLDGLLEAVPAEVGAILTVKEGRDLEVTAHRHRDPSIKTYTRVSDYVSNEVLRTREAILAEDVARDRYLRNRESLQAIWAPPA